VQLEDIVDREQRTELAALRQKLYDKLSCYDQGYVQDSEFGVTAGFERDGKSVNIEVAPGEIPSVFGIGYYVKLELAEGQQAAVESYKCRLRCDVESVFDYYLDEWL
jgi:hypothetical protein